MKIEIKRSELEAVRKKLKEDKGFFLTPCKDCNDGGVGDCCNEDFCREKKEYDKLYTIFKILEAYDIPNGYRAINCAAKELENATKYYSQTVKELQDKLSNLTIEEDLDIDCPEQD